jgi:PKD repeat protein
MKKEYLNIEDFFRQSLNGITEAPSAGLWERISLKLRLKEFLKPDFSTFNIYYSAILLGLIVGLGLILTNRNSNDQFITDKPIVLHIDSIYRDNNQTSKSEGTSEKLRINKINTDSSSSDSRVIISQQIPISHAADSSINIPVNLRPNFDPVVETGIDSADKMISLLMFPPKPLFTIANKEGCAPFEIKLKNLSLDALDYYWTFGDGGTSRDKSPAYTYLYPGIYKIQLKVKGLGGVAYSIIDSIVVYDKPNVKPYWPYESEFLVGEKILIPLEVQNAGRFEWDFGDGSIIHKKNAEYSYQSAGNYTIVLKTWSDENCLDSIKIADIEVVNVSDKIVFPNAFCPNPDGPSIGKYFERELYVDIFHPLLKGKLSEYKLVIYSKSGALVFESTDVKIGWDGYYENKMMPEGVYPFIASGKFEGGSRFIKKGNLTIIYRK